MRERNLHLKSASIIIIFILLNKVLAIYKDSIIAQKYGGSFESDAYFVSIAATMLFTTILSTAISTNILPILMKIEEHDGEKKKLAFVNNILNVTILLSILFTLIALIASPVIAKIIAPGFNNMQTTLVKELIKIGVLKIIFVPIGIFTIFLQSKNIFASSQVSPLFSNLVLIIYLIFLSNKYSINGLMYATVIAMIPQLIIQYISAKKNGFNYYFKIDLKDSNLGKVISLSVPAIISVAINDTMIMIDSLMASNLVEGSISALSYAEKLNGLVISIFIMAITTVIFPTLSRYSSDRIRFRNIINKGIRIILIICIHSTLVLLVYATPIVRVFFERGLFSERNTEMTAYALMFYSLGLIPMSLDLLFKKVFYSMQNTKMPMIFSMLNIILNTIFNFLLIPSMGHLGIALGTSISMFIGTIIQFLIINRQINEIIRLKSFIDFIKLIAYSLISVTVSYIAYHLLTQIELEWIPYRLISLGFSIALSIIIYFIMCCIFEVEEVKQLFDTLK